MHSSRKRLIILGATGSIGDSACRVLRQAPETFEVVGLGAHRNSEKLIALAQEFHTGSIALSGPGDHNAPEDCRVLTGPNASLDLLEQEYDILLAGMSGAAGLLPVMRALEQGRTVALANKEALVCAGSLMMNACREHNARLLPVDSEHNAIHQAIAGHANNEVSRITLTASGGPFLHTPLEELPHITPEQAIAHPKWRMGAKISVDSATMMNKALELIEAYWLFGLPAKAIDILIHPQAIVHGMAHFADGSTIAQLSEPDMAVPISYCLHWPTRSPLDAKPLNLATCGPLEFLEVDPQRFKAPALARHALQSGLAACIALNAANEIAVEAFLKRTIGFSAIVPLAEQACDHFSTRNIASITEVMALDAEVRHHTRTLVNESTRRYA